MDPRVVENPELLPSAPIVQLFRSPHGGVVARVDARTIGLAAVELGAGRELIIDEIDPAVGFEILVRPGERVERDAPLAEIHAVSEATAVRAAVRLQSAIDVDPEREATPDLGSRVLYRVDRAGITPA